MSQPNDAHTSATEPDADTARGWRIRFMILAAVLLFVATQVLLYYRWATMREPTCVLIVEAATALRGAEIEVTGPWSHEPYKAIVGSGERFSLPFYLEPGDYRVRVSQHGQSLYDGRIELTRERAAQRMDLSALQPAPATAPASAF